MDKKLDEVKFNTIKTTIDYPPKSKFCKLAQITKKLLNFGQVLPPFDIKLV